MSVNDVIQRRYISHFEKILNPHPRSFNLTKYKQTMSERSRSRSRSPARDDNKPSESNGDVKHENGGGGGGEDADGVKLYVGNLDYGKTSHCIGDVFY